MLQVYTDSVIDRAYEPDDVIWERKVPDCPEIKWAFHFVEKNLESEDSEDGERSLGMCIRAAGGSATVFGSFIIKVAYGGTITKPFQFDYVTAGEINFEDVCVCANDDTITCSCVVSFMPTPETMAVAPVMVHEMIDPTGLFDVTIVADGKDIKTHSAFLSMISPVFRAMFGPETIETQTGIVNITDFTHETIESAIDYCYGHLFNDKTAAEVIDMLRFYDKYDIPAAIDKLETYLVDNMTTKNVPATVNYAWEYSRKSLQTKCGEFFYGNAEDLACDEDFAKLDSCVIGDVVKAGVKAWKKSNPPEE